MPRSDRQGWSEEGGAPAPRAIPLLALFVLALLLTPAPAGATTQVGTAGLSGLAVVTVVDDGDSTEIAISRGTQSGSGEPFVAVQSTGVIPPPGSAGCESITPNLAVCNGAFDAVVALGNGGADEITMGLILEGQPPLRGEADGGPGNDVLESPADFREVPQPETVLAGGIGDDTLEGGNGADELRGGEGEDELLGFGGTDLFYGEEGDDLIDARDGLPEQVDCGAGLDIFDVDPADLLDASCEPVAGGPSPTPPTPTSPSQGTPATTPTVAPPSFGPQTLVTLALARKRIPAAGPLAVRVTNANGFAVSGELGGRIPLRTGPGGRVIKRASASLKPPPPLQAKPFSVVANGATIVKLTLPRNLRTALERSGMLTLEVTARVRDPAGTSRSVTQRLVPKLKQSAGKAAARRS